MASQVLKNQTRYLTLVAESEPKIKRKLIKEASYAFMKAVRELALNFLKGNLPCSEEEKANIKPYTLIIRYLSQKSKPDWYRRHLLIKYGEHFLETWIKQFANVQSDLGNDG